MERLLAESLDAGCIGKIAGCSVYISNNVQVTADDDGESHHCFARTRRAIAFAEQLSEIDAYRPELRFADAVKGLQDGEVYDGVLTNADASRFFIVRLDKTFDELATEQKKGTIITERKQARHDELLEQWREASEIVMNDDVIGQVVLTDSEPYIFKEESAG